MNHATKTPNKKKDGVTEVVHAHSADNHIVGIKTLHVLISTDDSGCFAQGLEIDYAAAGHSLDEVKENFENGLSATILEHLKMHGHLKHFLKVAPQEAWAEYFAAEAKLHDYSTIEAYDLAPKLVTAKKTTAKSMQDIGFPFEAIQFFGKAAHG